MSETRSIPGGKEKHSYSTCWRYFDRSPLWIPGYMRENHLKWIVQKYGLKVLNGFKSISMQFNDGFLYS